MSRLPRIPAAGASIRDIADRKMAARPPARGVSFMSSIFDNASSKWYNGPGL